MKKAIIYNKVEWVIATLLFAGILLASSCAKEVVEPGQSISGQYVLDDGSGLSNTYVSFKDGEFYCYSRKGNQTCTLAENTLWFSHQSDFTQTAKSPYSLSGGKLTFLNKSPFDKGIVKDDVLYVDGKTFIALKGFSNEYWSSISIPEGLTKKLDYTAQEVSVPISIVHPIPAGKIELFANTEWISDLSVEEGNVRFSVSQTNEDATAEITLTYTNAAPITLTVTRSPFTITPPSQEVTYTGGSFSFDFAVTNPREGASVTAASQSDWITDVQLSGNTVSYKAAENNSYFSRSGKIRLSYGSYATKDFSVNQSSHPITTFSLNKTELALLTGNSKTLQINTFPEDVSYNWSSNNTSVATVSQSGLVSAIGNGTALITVISSDETKSATCAVTVTTAVTGVSLNQSTLFLGVGASETLTATVSPSTASNKNVTWVSSNPAVASVDQSGRISAQSLGSAIITVTTEDGNKSASCNLMVKEVVELSSSATANCYIVSDSGLYKFKTVKGNSSESVGNVSATEVLWESFGTSTAPSKGDIISSVSYSDSYITLSTPSALYKGNAVIAAKDSEGNILWSWHIWVCKDYNPSATAQTYANNAGVMMDRNLGATSATPGDAGALGLLYQWGRKDPFLGSSSISSSSKAASTLSWPSTVSSNSSNGTIEYAVAHPTTFITDNRSNCDWYYTGSSSTDNTRWQTSKTIYDPCPPGWKVPAGGSAGVWSKAVGSSSSFSYTWNSTNRGMNFSGKFGSASTIWYPAAGSLNIGDGSFRDVGGGGYWWSCTPNDGRYAYSLLLNYGGGVYPSSYHPGHFRAYGFSVRCLKE